MNGIGPLRLQTDSVPGQRLMSTPDAGEPYIVRHHRDPELRHAAPRRAEFQAFRADFYRELLIQTRWLTAAMLAFAALVMVAVELD